MVNSWNRSKKKGKEQCKMLLNTENHKKTKRTQRHAVPLPPPLHALRALGAWKSLWRTTPLLSLQSTTPQFLLSLLLPQLLIRFRLHNIECLDNKAGMGDSEAKGHALMAEAQAKLQKSTGFLAFIFGCVQLTLLLSAATTNFCITPMTHVPDLNAHCNF